MSLKEVKRTAAIAWSPPLQTSPLLATGTLAGALDASFSTHAELEIHNLLLDDKSLSSVTKSVISCPSSEAALIAQCEGHQGPVRGLQVNPFQPFLVASGATDAEIWLWDLNNLQQPYSPSANKSSKLEDITDLAWNRIVPHILATASNSGVTVVWDLKSRKEVLQLSAPSQRISASAIAWNPENATQLLVASDDDQNPLIYSWDLRNARAPEKGILSLAWCPKDAELLLSCGKDNKSICWNPKAGSVVAELTHSDNWMFDIQWCLRNPDLFSTASFSGFVEINSFQSLMSGGTRVAPQAANAEDFFAMTSSGVVQRTSAPTHVQIPKWLRRPIGISFGFGGRAISFSSLRSDSSRIVSIIAFVVPMAEKLVVESKKLDLALSNQTLIDYCIEKIPRPVPNLHAIDDEAVFWNVAKVMLESDPQEKLLNLLGFDKVQLEDQMKKLALTKATAHSPKEATNNVELPKPQNKFVTSPMSHEHDFFSGSIQEGTDVDFQSLVSTEEAVRDLQNLRTATQEPSQTLPNAAFDEIEFQLFGPESSEIDKTITSAIIQGNFEAAVDLCVKADRLSDALLVAICGGDNLVAKTQQIYFQKSRYPYLRVVSGIVKKDLTDVVEHAHIDNWEEVLALICSYSKGIQFTHLCNVLGSRIERAIAKKPSFAIPALICFMAAGNASKAVSLLLSQASKTNIPEKKEYNEYAIWLETIVEKTRIIEMISGLVAPDNVVALQDVIPAVSDKFIEYAYIMADNGLLDIAVRYFNSFSNDRSLNGEDDLVVIFGDQLSKATKALDLPLRPIPIPFSSLDVIPEMANEAIVPEQSTGVSQATQHQPVQAGTQPWKNPAIQTMSQPSSQTMSAFGLPQMMPTATHIPAGQSNFGAPMQPFGTIPPVSAPSRSFGSTSPTQASTQLQSVTQQPSVPAPPMPLIPQQTYNQPTSTHYGTQSAITSRPPMPLMNPMTSSSMASQPFQSTPYGTAPPVAAQAQPGPQQQSGYASPPAMPSIPMSRPMMSVQSGSPSQQAPVLAPNPSMVPPQPRPIASPPPSETSSRRSTGAYNDPPMVAPRIPVASTAPIEPRPTMLQSAPRLGSIPMNPPTQPQTTTTIPSMPVKTSPGPVDPAKIPSNLHPIFKTLSTLIMQCQERALPMQRRVVEDSARRMQSLFHQLVNQELSPPVLQIINEMCANINSGQYERAHELHGPLMTSHFSEAGAWVLAAKRLIEIAKICLH